uniref:Uncharacterized protein n=1 Tax=Oryza barthii TaxID=65489 RepID=A0A0D3H6C5_9ORYZ
MGSAAGAGASVAARVCRRPSMDDPYPGLDDPSGARSTWDLAARRCQGLRLAPLPAVASAAPRRKSAPGDGIAVMSLTEKTRSKPSGLPARSTPLCRANRRREIQFQYLAMYSYSTSRRIWVRRDDVLPFIWLSMLSAMAGGVVLKFSTRKFIDYTNGPGPSNYVRS